MCNISGVIFSESLSSKLSKEILVQSCGIQLKSILSHFTRKKNHYLEIAEKKSRETFLSPVISFSGREADRDRRRFLVAKKKI